MSEMKPYVTVKDIRIQSMSAVSTPPIDEDTDRNQTEFHVRHQFELRTVLPGPDNPLDENEMAALLSVVINTPVGEITAAVEGSYLIESDKEDLLTEDNFIEFLNDEALVELVAYLRATVSDLAMRVFRATLNMPPFSHLNLHFEHKEESEESAEGI